jgi:DNA-binding IclR family transcriptional regulator
VCIGDFIEWNEGRLRMDDEHLPRGRRPAHGEPVLDRAFRIMTAFGPAHRSLSLAALSGRAGLPKPTALRLARKLVDWGALERVVNGDYVVGLRLLEIASLAPRGHGLRTTALPYMEDLHHATRTIRRICGRGSGGQRLRQAGG